MGLELTYAKMILPSLERCNDLSASDDIDETLEQNEYHLATKLMKEVPNLSASNAIKSSKGNGELTEMISNNRQEALNLDRATKPDRKWHQLGCL